MRIFFLLSLLLLHISLQLKGQYTVNYSDINYLQEVKAKTTLKREFLVTKDSIISRAFRRDTIISQGVYYGFNKHKEIAPFEVYHKTEKLVELRRLKLKDRFAIVDLYEKGVKKEKVKYQTGEVYTLQKWVNEIPILEDGNGRVVEYLETSIRVEVFKDYKRSKE